MIGWSPAVFHGSKGSAADVVCGTKTVRIPAEHDKQPVRRTADGTYERATARLMRQKQIVEQQTIGKTNGESGEVLSPFGVMWDTAGYGMRQASSGFVVGVP